MENTAPSPTIKNGRLTQITVADVLFGCVLLLAIIMRFSGLGGQLLTPAEAEAAWQVWAFWQPDTNILAEGSPIYATLTRLLAPILGFTDATMRLVPAFFGVGVVTLPWLWRNRLGTLGALITSLLLTVSPIQSVVSRTVGGDSAAVFALLLFWIAFFQFIEYRTNRWLYLAAAAAALGLSSTPLFYSGLLTFAIAFICYQAVGIPIFEEATWPQIDNHTRQKALIILGGLFLAITTLFLWYPAGIGAAARIPATWIAQFGFNLTTAPAPFLALLRYEVGPVFLGIIAMGWAAWRSHPLASFCVYWIALIIVMALVQPGEQSLMLLILLPITFMVGFFGDALLNNGPLDSITGLTAIGGFTLLMLIWVNLARFTRTAVATPDELLNVWIIMLAIFMTMTALFLLAARESTNLIPGTFLALILFFLFYSWGTAWWLGHEGLHDTRERWHTAGTDDDARILIQVIDELSLQITNSATDLDILSHVDTPVLRWYLREYVNLEFADTIPASATHAVLITPADRELALASEYIGSDYGLLRQEPVLVSGQDRLMDTLRWWLFQESPTTIPETRVILWLRSDLGSTN